MKKRLLLSLCFLFPSVLLAEWNIEKPSQNIPKTLTGNIFGKEFTLGQAEWNQHALTLRSQDKMGVWPESELLIFLKQEENKNEWLITPDQSDFNDPHIHMKFGKKGSQFPGTLMFTSEYSLYLKLLKKDAKKALFQIHLSLPDYEKSFLLGSFTAKITK